MSGIAIASESFGLLFPIKKPKIRKGIILIKRELIVLIYFFDNIILPFLVALFDILFKLKN